MMAGSVLHVYTDDILLYRTINSTHDFLSLQSDISIITAWSCANFLNLNRSKCKFMVLSRQRSPSYPVIPLTIGDHPLEQVMSFKYLGVHLSCDLSWSMHIETMHHIQSQESGMSFVSTVLQFFTTCCSSLPLPITCETTLRICFSCMESLEERHSSTGECADILVSTWQPNCGPTHMTMFSIDHN